MGLPMGRLMFAWQRYGLHWQNQCKCLVGGKSRSGQGATFAHHSAAVHLQPDVGLDGLFIHLICLHLQHGL